MDRLVLHPQTRQQVERFAAMPNHAVILVGPPGSGKQSVAELLARQLLEFDDSADIYSYPYLHFITPAADKRSIGIEAVRELQHITALKLPKPGQRRLIIVHEAHVLTTEAQNALLKLLEEPPDGSHFILTASDPQSLLPTIRSRSQQLTVHRPGKAELIAHFTAAGYDAKTIEQAFFMSGGLPGLIHAILSDQDHPLKTAAQTARQLLQSSQFERLCQVDALAKSREQTLNVLAVLRLMAQAALNQTANNSTETTDPSATSKRLKQWHRVLQASYDAEQAFAVSAQAKLTLTNLMLNL